MLDKYAPAEGPAIPTAYLLPPAAPVELAPTAAGAISSTIEPNIQKIPRIEDNIAVDGRVGKESLHVFIVFRI